MMRNVRVIQTSRGVRCQTRKGKFTRCPAGVAGLDDYGDFGAIQHISTRGGVRCRSTVTNRFVRCPGGTGGDRTPRRRRRRRARRRRY